MLTRSLGASAESSLQKMPGATFVQEESSTGATAGSGSLPVLSAISLDNRSHTDAAGLRGRNGISDCHFGRVSKLLEAGPDPRFDSAGRCLQPFGRFRVTAVREEGHLD